MDRCGLQAIAASILIAIAIWFVMGSPQRSPTVLIGCARSNC
jgi:hypothetical protein